MALLQQGVADDLELSGKSGSDAVLQSAVRKAALRFVPLLTIAYLFNYLDRTSLGFAALTMIHASARCICAPLTAPLGSP